MYKSEDIAQFVVNKLTNTEAGSVVTNLKLQKLLYYLQGFSLSINNRSLFQDSIKAWNYGPVVPNVYHTFKNNGHKAIEPVALDLELQKDDLDLITDVLDVYGQFSAIKLMEMTHQEDPWKSTPTNRTISKEKIKSYFKDNLVE